MVNELRYNVDKAMPYGELRRSPEWLDTVSKMREAQKNQDLDSVLDFHGQLEMLAKAYDVSAPVMLDIVSKMREAQKNQDLDSVLDFHRQLEMLAEAYDVAAAEMLAKQHRMDEAEEMLRQAQLFIDDSGNHPSDDYYRRFMALELQEMLRKLQVGVNADLHRIGDLEAPDDNEMLRKLLAAIDADVQDLNRAGDLEAPDGANDNEMLRKLLEAIDADVQNMNRAGDLEAPDGALVQNELDAYWNERLDPIEVLEPIDGEADAVSDSVRTSVTGAAGSVEDATPRRRPGARRRGDPARGPHRGFGRTPRPCTGSTGSISTRWTLQGKPPHQAPPSPGELPSRRSRTRKTNTSDSSTATSGSRSWAAAATCRCASEALTGFLLPGFGIEEMKGLKKLLPKKQPACRLTLRSELRQVPGRDRGAAPGQRGR